jgi:hypothetical protein
MSRGTLLAVPFVRDATWSGGATNYVVQTLAGALYAFYVDGGSDCAYVKSLDGGVTWSTSVIIHTGTVVQVAVWYDRWSDVAGDVIHVAYASSANDDVMYRSLDTSSDTLGTERTVAALGSTSSNPALSIARARGGNLLCAYDIDGGTEHGCARSTDGGTTWGSVATPTEAAGAGDFLILLPGWAADNQDMMCLFWDKSASEISRKLYDDSANSWAETSIAASMTAPVTANGQFDYAAAVDIANSQNLLCAWSVRDTANADLRFWTVTEAAITEKTAPITDTAGEQGVCALAIDTSRATWYVFYGGKADGSETFGSSTTLNYKVSSDSGATWSAELPANLLVANPAWVGACPRRAGTPIIGVVPFLSANANPYLLNRDIPGPRANYLLGI